MSKKDKNTVYAEFPKHDFRMILNDNHRYISLSDVFSFLTRLAENIDNTKGVSPYTASTVRAVRDHLDSLGLDELRDKG